MTTTTRQNVCRPYDGKQGCQMRHQHRFENPVLARAWAAAYDRARDQGLSHEGACADADDRIRRRIRR